MKYNKEIYILISHCNGSVGNNQTAEFAWKNFTHYGVNNQETCIFKRTLQCLTQHKVWTKGFQVHR